MGIRTAAGIQLPGWESRMQLLPMASSPDGLISARYAVITNNPGWEVLTTTSLGGGGEWAVCTGEEWVGDETQARW